MSKPATYPTLFNDALQLNVSKLKGWGYLKQEQSKSGTLTWSSRGQKTGCISIWVNMDAQSPYVQLNYNFRDEPRSYKIFLASKPSNLGKGRIWYFVCPETNKRCRKLYSIGGYFLHREAFNGCMYKSQTHSKRWREIERVYGSYFDADHYYSELYSKHFKTHYKGKPTKRYLRLVQKINEGQSHRVEDIERLLIFG